MQEVKDFKKLKVLVEITSKTEKYMKNFTSTEKTEKILPILVKSAELEIFILKIAVN